MFLFSIFATSKIRSNKDHQTEGCPSGWRSTPGKCVYGQPYREFESLPLCCTILFMRPMRTFNVLAFCWLGSHSQAPALQLSLRLRQNLTVTSLFAVTGRERRVWRRSTGSVRRRWKPRLFIWRWIWCSTKATWRSLILEPSTTSTAWIIWLPPSRLNSPSASRWGRCWWGVGEKSRLSLQCSWFNKYIFI